VLCILSWSDFVRRDGEGRVVLDNRSLRQAPARTALWAAPLPPHTLENSGKSELRAISVELKTRARQARKRDWHGIALQCQKRVQAPACRQTKSTYTVRFSYAAKRFLPAWSGLGFDRGCGPASL
jgi:hypothetical protein